MKNENKIRDELISKGFNEDNLDALNKAGFENAQILGLCNTKFPVADLAFGAKNTKKLAESGVTAKAMIEYGTKYPFKFASVIFNPDEFLKYFEDGVQLTDLEVTGEKPISLVDMLSLYKDKINQLLGNGHVKPNHIVKFVANNLTDFFGIVTDDGHNPKGKRSNISFDNFNKLVREGKTLEQANKALKEQDKKPVVGGKTEKLKSERQRQRQNTNQHGTMY